MSQYCFGIEITPEYQQILVEETEKARHYTSNHTYSLGQMGLDDTALTEEFNPIIKDFGMETPKIE